MSAGARGLLHEEAPAKLNLYLHVVGRRPDGYHELDSLVAFVALGDALTAVAADELSLTIEGPFAEGLSAGADNLVIKAAALLAVTPAPILPARVAATPTLRARDPDAGVQSSPEKSLDSRFRGNDDRKEGSVLAKRSGAALTLTKNLPVASGIGGGSADAAAALRLLRRLWGIGVSDDDLAALGLKLGADVPVCLRARPTILRGIGEQLSEAPALPSAGLVLVNPRIPLATPDVFRRRGGPFSAPAPFAAPRDVAALAAALLKTRNDLEAPAMELVPQIGMVLEALRASPGCRLARLSGSGATCFGLYDDPAMAEQAAAWLSAREHGWWIRPTRWAT